MDGIDAPVLEEPIEAGDEFEAGPEETQEVEQQAVDGQQATDPADEDPYGSKASKEFSNALKAWKDANPEMTRFARMAKDDHARLFQLHQFEPKGIDGVREKYALLDSVMHGDLKGVEAVGALQDELRGIADLDERIVQGDLTVLDQFGDEMRAGIMKMVPGILEQQRQADPEGYANAILPHLVDALKSSELVGGFNSLVDVLNEAPPKWLTPNQTAEWTQDKMGRLVNAVKGMGNWFNAQEQKAAGLKNPANQPQRGQNGRFQAKPNSVDEREANLTKREQAEHWQKNITPNLDKHAGDKFTELFKPYAKRLRLDQAGMGALKSAFVQGVVKRAAGNPAYMSQITRYHSQRNPDANAVTNYAKVEFDKHASEVMSSIVKERYGAYLNGKPRTAAPAPQNGQRPSGPVPPNVKVVNVMPNRADIDHKNTPLDWMHTKADGSRKFRMRDGSVVMFRPNR